MNLEEIINKRGGRLVLEDLEPILKYTYASAKQRCVGAIQSAVLAFPSLKSIEFDIIDDYTFNAFACVDNGNYFIGINRGVIATLHLLFDRMLADRRFMPSFGKIEKLDENLPVIENITSNYEFTVEKLQFFDPPKDEERKLYSTFLVEQSIDFILAHEIAHILNGHVDYLKNKFDLISSELEMIGYSSKSEKLIFKTLEMDADQGAVSALFASETNKMFGKIKVHSSFKMYYENDADVFVRFAFVSSIVYRIFGDQRLDFVSFHGECYPKPSLRSLISLVQIAEFLKSSSEQLEHSLRFELYGIPQWAKKGYYEAQWAILMISGKKSDLNYITDVWGEVGREQINMLYRCWNDELMDQLQPYSHITLSQKKYIARKDS